MNLIWIYIFFTVKNSYLIYVLLKNSNFFLGIFLQYSTHFIKKNTKINLKIGTKNSDEIFVGTKSWKKIFRGIKTKSCYIYRDKNIFNPIFFHVLYI